jgi:hypothetical protein
VRGLVARRRARVEDVAAPETAPPPQERLR